jgi:hypothetical protein
MEHTSETMNSEEVAELLSKTMRDLADRKITLRQAEVMSRIAVALSRVIETTDLNDRIELLEQMLKKSR